jgi:hypothetical protein
MLYRFGHAVTLVGEEMGSLPFAYLHTRLRFSVTHRLILGCHPLALG